MASETLDLKPLNVDPAEVYRYLGVRDASDPSPAIRRLVAQACALGPGLLRPAASCAWLAASYRGTLVKLEDGTSLDTGRPLRGWDGLERVAICLCTLGPALEAEVTRLFKQGEAALAMGLGAFGSAAMEALGTYMRGVICTEAATAGMSVGAHGEPGTGLWDLRDQQMLFRLVAGDSLGVRLTERSILVPLKSLCFVVPAGKKLKPTKPRTRCGDCNMVGCAYRARSAPSAEP